MPKEEILFFTQVILIYVIAITSIVNLTMEANYGMKLIVDIFTYGSCSHYSRFKARGSWLVARGSWLAARGSRLYWCGSWLAARGSRLYGCGSWLEACGSKLVVNIVILV